MELRQLEAFVAVTTELHFGRAAARLRMAQPTLSELVRRLERELGTALLIRTTRRVSLTEAGSELLGRAKVILDGVAAAKAAVQGIADGNAGTVRLGMTPPVAPALAPHLAASLEREAPSIQLESQRLWVSELSRAVADGAVDVAITCGRIPDREGVEGAVFSGEPLLVGLRHDHPLASAEQVGLDQLRHDVLGVPNASLFPAWAMAQDQVLLRLGVQPPRVVLEAADVTAADWPGQAEIDWVLLTRSVGAVPLGTVARPIAPLQVVPYKTQWNLTAVHSPAVGRFVRLALTVDPPAGWLPGPGHLRHGNLEPSRD